jgi:hypothetical protein
MARISHISCEELNFYAPRCFRKSAGENHFQRGTNSTFLPICRTFPFLPFSGKYT